MNSSVPLIHIILSLIPRRVKSIENDWRICYTNSVCIASRKGEGDLAIGNIVGSCIFNIGIVMGIPVAIFGGINEINFNNFDILTMLLSVVLLFVFSINDRKITRKEGFIFLLLFMTYYAITIING